MLFYWLRTSSYIIFGCIIGVYLCNYEYFRLDPTLEIGDIFSLSVTTLIGLYIAKNIQKQQSSDRKEKDFIIEEVQNLRLDIAVIISYNEIGTYPFDLTKATIKTINKKIIQIQALIKISTYCRRVNVKQIDTLFKASRRIILQVSPINNNITLSPIQKTQTETKLSSMNQEIYKLILSINNA